MTADTRRLFAQAVRREPVDLGLACALLAAENNPDTDIGAQLARLDALAEAARPLAAQPGSGQAGSGQAGSGQAGAGLVGGSPADGGAGGLAGADPRAVAEGLAAALGGREGFAGRPADYDDLRASLLPDVLRRRRGLPILLSIVWLEVARRLEVDAYPITLPGHVIVGIGPPGHGVLVDPFAGGRVITVHEAAEKVRAAGVPFTRSLLAAVPPADLMMRVLTNIRVLAARKDARRTRLWAVELSLLLPHHPAGLRRERGELLVEGGDFLGGAAELEAFAGGVDAVEPAAAAAARRAARTARARLN